MVEGMHSLVGAMVPWAELATTRLQQPLSPLPSAAPPSQFDRGFNRTAEGVLGF